MNPRDNEIERIKKDILESGLPLEVEISETLKQNEWTVRNQSYYLDYEEEKGRSIDILAVKRFKTRNSQIFDEVEIDLVIECKKSMKPWVFHTVGKNEDRYLRAGKIKELGLIPFGLYVKPWLNPKIDRSIIPEKIDKSYLTLFFEQITRLCNISHYLNQNYNQIGIIPYVAFTKKGEDDGRDDLFKAKNQVIKATIFQSDCANAIIKMHNEYSIGFIYPIIVLDGKLYQYRRSGNLDVVPIQYILYRTHYHKFQKQRATDVLPEAKQFLAKTEDHYLIDVVKKDFFPNYLQIVEKEIEGLNEFFS